MKLTIEIDLDGAAFEPLNGDEVGRILEGIANDYYGSQLGPDPYTGEPTEDNIRDTNGNTCGFVRVSEV